ncbi:LysR family transcriptional regulator [Spirillospora sp. CA-294931]|uniref:LysR family transcriptional regulator n=1 Tax=Spirillospora sp. CA-294931 TaxID=3240042 RepID=UPI003D8E873E
MSLEARELEAFLVLSEELHFGRAAQRLYVSQGRISQLLRALEGRIGGRLLHRTSRRVELTPLGRRFLDDLRPAYAALENSITRARQSARGISGVVRVGFIAYPTPALLGSIDALRRDHPTVQVDTVEIPLRDPFGPLRRGEVDASFVCLPVREPDLTVGPVFNRVPQTLALSSRHPFASRAAIPAEELGDFRLIGIAEPAPRYWTEPMAPTVTPGGRPIPQGPKVGTLPEGLTMVATDRGAMLFCAPTAEYHGRSDVAFIPVTGLPVSKLALIYPATCTSPTLHAFVQAAEELGIDALTAPA